jgi:hypothetical protein
MTLFKILFWIAFALDAGAVCLWFVLGLAAAGSTRDSPLMVALYLLIGPGIVLAGLGFWFAVTNSMVGRLIAFGIVASPVMVVLAAGAATEIRRLMHPEEAKVPVAFAPPNVKELQAAILRDDVEGVKREAAAVELGGRAVQEGPGLLAMSLRRMEKSAGQRAVFVELLKAGAKPTGGYGEPPLLVAIKGSGRTGAEPVTLLLAAGARPGDRTSLGVPVFFAAMGKSVNIEILRALLERGVDVNQKSVQGRTALEEAATAGNWGAVRLLLERGADVQFVKSESGRSFREMVEASAGSGAKDEDFAAVLRSVRGQ